MKLTKGQITYRRKKLKDSLIEQFGCCTNCGSHYNLTLSHLIPVSQNKSLELEYRNITIHCIDCHKIWEHGEWKTKYLRIKDFKELLSVIKIIDEKYYNRLFIKMPEWLQCIIENY